MNGKICMVTGATSGIGKSTAQELARLGATVIIIGRNPDKCEQTVAELRTASGNPQVHSLLADLSSQAAIRRMATEFKGQYPRLDVLVNNAGSAFLWRGLSVDGIERTFALNHLSYFLLTNLLIDTLIASAPARIVNVASGIHFGKQLDFDNLELKRGYGPLKAYGLSKLANILFTYELDRRFHERGVTANALNPGMVMTNIWRNLGPVIGPFISWLVSKNGQTPEEGAQGVIYLASSPEVEGQSGKYFRKTVEMKSDPITYDSQIAQQLWEVSEAMTGLKA
jgi:NAD(P)-dependent dehydrogenase (short-subunit alcohol dehydrogenase family)